MTMQVLTTDRVDEWMGIVEQSPQHDFYHLPQYHAMAEDAGEGRALLFHHQEGAYSIALPLLIRSLHRMPGIRTAGAHWQDATSVYGYAGPVASSSDIPGPIVRSFQTSLETRLREMDVVSVFSRLHPIIPQQTLLAGMGECRTLGQTVSMDLTLTPESQYASFRKSVKGGIGKLRRRGVTCAEDRGGLYLDTFVEVYHETMRRVDAALGYFFPRSYFHKLADGLGDRFHLFVCIREGQVLCGGIFIESGGILQYHLGGTRNSALELAPMKLLFDDVRIWANAKGLKFIHLGGGASMSPEDSLLHFKRGFSERTHDFAVWRWILFPDVYRSLCAERSRWNHQNGLALASENYFPEYRSPAVSQALPPAYPVGAGISLGREVHP